MQRIDFILNPISGGKSKAAALRAIESGLDKSRYESRILWTAAPGDGVRLAAESTADIIVAVGGDGTVNEVARGLLEAKAAGEEKTLGILPCGSGNGLAFHLGLSRQMSRAVATLNEGAVTSIDLGEMNGEIFCCTAGMGIDANVSLHFAQSTGRGLKNYIALAWDEWKHHEEFVCDVECDGEKWSGKALFVTVANANQWGNEARIAPMASLRDGLLDVIVVRNFKTVEIPALAAKLLSGTLFNNRHLIHFRGSQILLRRTTPGPVHKDGDAFEAGKELRLRILPQALKVTVPADRLGKI